LEVSKKKKERAVKFERKKKIFLRPDQRKKRRLIIASTDLFDFEDNKSKKVKKNFCRKLNNF
jgi:hypothetical protein